MTGTKVPEDVVLDGQSHLPLLLGEELKRTKPLQWHHYNTNSQHSPNPNAVMRIGNEVICGFYDPKTQPGRASWRPEHLEKVRQGKLVRFALFDLSADPGQLQDLAGRETKRFLAMKVELIRAHDEMRSQAVGWNGVEPVRPDHEFSEPPKVE